jgi:signal transduction histidine kinase
MNWFTTAWPMVAAACLTLGLIELSIGLRQPPRAPRLLFALSAFAVAAIAGLELALLRADTLAQWSPVMRGLDIAVGVMLVSLTAFIWVYFGTGTKWLACLVPGLYAAGLMFDYLPGKTMTYEAVTGFRTVETVGGATFNVAEGVPAPWNVLPYLAVLALILFAGNASVGLWRRGGRRRAAVVGGAVVFFLTVAGGHSALVETGIVQTPYLISWAYLAILLAMAGELHADVLAAAQLAYKLEESEGRMELAGVAANLGMWTWDIARDSIWATKRARAMFGFSESDPLNLTRVLSAMHSEDRGRAERAIMAAVAGIAELDIELRVAGPDGAVRWVAVRGQVENSSGARLLGVVIDVTGRKIAELQAERDRAELQHMARVSLLGQLSASIAHELNQPLGAIYNNVSAAKILVQSDPPRLDEVLEALDDIQRDDRRASDVIARIRKMLRNGEIEASDLDLNETIDDTVKLLAHDAGRREALLEQELAPGLPAVHADRVQVQQVILNLVLNALDAVAGEPPARRRVLLRSARAGDGEAEVTVVDSGPGLPEEVRSRVFQPFVTTKAGGMGMGLSISRTIVEAHGGRIRAENPAGGGAAFHFTLPFASAPRA